MKKQIFLFLFLMAFVPVKGQEQYQAGVVAFYNLENLFDTLNTEGVNDEEFTVEGPNEWNSRRYQEKLDRLAEVISRLGSDEGIQGGPAILGVSEIENRSVLEDLIAHPLLVPGKYQIIHYDSPDLRGIDVALLYQSGVFVPTNSHSAGLLLFDDDGSRIYTRDQLLVSGLFNGEKMHFIVNHWPSRRGGEKASRPRRNAAAALTRSLVDSLLQTEPGARIVVMGDLNDDPVNQSVNKILRAGSNPDKLKEGDLYNCMFPLFRKGIGSLAYRDAWNLFDQIIVSQGLLGEDKTSFKFFTARVYNKDFLTQQDGQYKGYPFRTYVGNTWQGGYSDHFPVYIVLIRQAGR